MYKVVKLVVVGSDIQLFSSESVLVYFWPIIKL